VFMCVFMSCSKERGVVWAEKMKKGQGAAEFFMTYGWAIAVVFVVMVALVYYGGVFNNPFIGEADTIDLACEKYAEEERNLTNPDCHEESFSVGVCVCYENIETENTISKKRYQKIVFRLKEETLRNIKEERKKGEGE